MFAAIKRLLFPSRDEHRNTVQLNPIDAELVAEDLDVYQSGATDGRNDTPGSDSANFTLAEVQITGFFQGEAQRAEQFFRGKILDLQKLLKQKSLARYEDLLSSIVPSFKATINTIVAQSKPHLVELKRREKELHDEYMAFRRTNHLTRSADYPENLFFLVTILIGILLIEAILNGYFFAQANEFGLVGGVSQATITAGINITIGWLFGRFAFTQVNHYSKPRSYVSLAIVPVLFVCSVIFYNLFIGHFRDTLAAAVDTDAIAYASVVQDDLRSAWTNPLGLQSFDSWLLVLLGIVFSLIAAADGYNFNDPYPGYGKVAKKHEVARQDYSDDKQDFLDELADLREEVGNEVESIKFDIDAQSRSIHDIMTATKKREGEYDAYMRDLENNCNHVLQLYRTSNRQARKSNSPKYFDESYKLTDNIHSPPLEAFDVGELQKQLDNVGSLLQSVSQVALDVDKAYTRAIDKVGEELEQIEA